MKNFLKGIVVGLGGVAPGLSGSVLMVMFGLYQKTIACIGSILNLKKFKENLTFLIPLGLGMGVGVVIFASLVDYLLENFEVLTCFAFLGLILGTLPLLNREVKKEGFKKKYYFVIGFFALLGLYLFYGTSGIFTKIETPNTIQAVLMGLSVAGSYIVPGVDSAAILNALGFYDAWIKILAGIKDLNFDFAVLFPLAVGLIAGVLAISFVMNKLLSLHYTATFSVIFGLFLSVIPSVIINMETKLNFGFNGETVSALVIAIIGFALSYYLGDIAENNKKIKKLFKK
ncbi:MAG: DUF368 domain-containing protein [Clostridia bacterium]|nr:DUF368 domain-containing protein [Clostridia bacterium]